MRTRMNTTELDQEIQTLMDMIQFWMDKQLSIPSSNEYFNNRRMMQRWDERLIELIEIKYNRKNVMAEKPLLTEPSKIIADDSTPISFIYYIKKAMYHSPNFKYKKDKK